MHRLWRFIAFATRQRDLWFPRVYLETAGSVSAALAALSFPARDSFLPALRLPAVAVSFEEAGSFCRFTMDKL